MTPPPLPARHPASLCHSEMWHIPQPTNYTTRQSLFPMSGTRFRWLSTCLYSDRQAEKKGPRVPTLACHMSHCPGSVCYSVFLSCIKAETPLKVISFSSLFFARVVCSSTACMFWVKDEKTCHFSKWWWWQSDFQIHCANDKQYSKMDIESLERGHGSSLGLGRRKEERKKKQKLGWFILYFHYDAFGNLLPTARNKYINSGRWKSIAIKPKEMAFIRQLNAGS